MTAARKLIIVGAVVAASGAASVLAGLWNPKSVRFAPELAQTAGLWLADHMKGEDVLHEPAVWIARQALLVHRSGVSVADASLASSVFEYVGEKDKAATLALGLATRHFSLGEVQQAREQAKRAFALRPTEDALTAIVFLQTEGETADGSWISRFAERKRHLLFPGASFWSAHARQLPAIKAMPAWGEAEQPWKVSSALHTDWSRRWNAVAGKQDQGYWFAELRLRFPENELVRAKDCLDGLTAFDTDVPRACEQVRWLGPSAASGKREHTRLSKEIASLPQRAAEAIDKAERSRDVLWRNQDALRQSDAALARRRDGLVGEFLGDTFVRLLPLPRPGDTLETYIVHTGICSLWFVRWLCRGGEIAGAFEDMQNNRMAIESTLASNAREYEQAARSLAALRSELEWWRGPGPLSQLVQARERLLPDFRKSAHGEVKARYRTPGLTLDDAVAML